jgi:hypothetical protein
MLQSSYVSIYQQNSYQLDIIRGNRDRDCRFFACSLRQDESPSGCSISCKAFCCISGFRYFSFLPDEAQVKIPPVFSCDDSGCNYLHVLWCNHGARTISVSRTGSVILGCKNEHLGLIIRTGPFVFIQTCVVRTRSICFKVMICVIIPI